jgi:superfamily I DNA and RNA helicase
VSVSVTAGSMEHRRQLRHKVPVFYGNQLLKIQVLWDVVLFRWGCGVRRSIGSYCLHRQAQAIQKRTFFLFHIFSGSA